MSNINSIIDLFLNSWDSPYFLRSHLESYIKLKQRIEELFANEVTIPIRNAGQPEEMMLRINGIHFSAGDNDPIELCKRRLKGYDVKLTLSTTLYMTKDPTNTRSNEQSIDLTAFCGYQETDPWGLKDVLPRKEAYGCYMLTTKGSPKYPIILEEDNGVSWGKIKNKDPQRPKNAVISYSVSLDRSFISAFDIRNSLQYLKIVFSFATNVITLECKSEKEDLKIPEVNMVILACALSGLTVEQAMKFCMHSYAFHNPNGEYNMSVATLKAVFEYAKITLGDMTPYQFIEKSGMPLDKFMSYYASYHGTAYRKGLYLLMHIRRLLTYAMEESYHPSRDSVQRRRYLTIGDYVFKYVRKFVDNIMTIEKLNKPKNDLDSMAEIVNKYFIEIQKSMHNDVSQGKHGDFKGMYIRTNGNIFSQLSTVTLTSRKMYKEIAKLFDFRQYNFSQANTFCPYDAPEHGDNVGLEKRLAIISKVCSTTPKERGNLILELIAFCESRLAPVTDPCIVVVAEDVVIGAVDYDTGYKLFLDVRHHKRRNYFSSKDFGVAFDPILKELRFSVGNGRIIRPIMVVQNGVMDALAITAEDIKKAKKFDKLCEMFPDAFEWIDTEQYLVSSSLNYRVCENAKKFLTLSEEARKQCEYCLFDDWVYYGWVVTHKPFLPHDDAIRKVFSCCQLRSSVSNTTPDKYTYDAYLQPVFAENLLFETMTMKYTKIGQRGAIHTVYIMMSAAKNGANQEDGVILNARSAENGLMCIINVDKQQVPTNSSRTLNQTTGIHYKHSHELIDPISGQLLENSVISKGHALARTIEYDSTGKVARDLSEAYSAFFPARVVETRVVDEKTVCVLLASTHYLAQGNKVTTASAQKSTVSTICPPEEFPRTPTGEVADMLVSPLAILNRRTVSVILAGLVYYTVILGQYRNGTIAKLRISPTQQSDLKEAAKKLMEAIEHHRTNVFDTWHGEKLEDLALQIRVMYDPITHEYILQQFLPCQYLITKHIAQAKKNVCPKGKVSQQTRQMTAGKKNSGGAKIDAMTRDVTAAYGAANTLHEILSEPEERKTVVHICSNCGMFARIVREKIEYAVCDSCRAQYGYSNTKEVVITYTVAKFLDLQRGRGINIKFHFQEDAPINPKLWNTIKI